MVYFKQAIKFPDNVDTEILVLSLFEQRVEEVGREIG